MTTSLLWFRRDLRLADHPALLAAMDAAGDVVPVFVLDPILHKASGKPRLAFLYGCLTELVERTGGAIRIVSGDPVEVIPRLASQLGVTSVHVSADYGGYGRARDSRVADALGDVSLVRTGSPYAIAPGTLRTGSGAPFQVFTPFSRAWRSKGWHEPAGSPGSVRWSDGSLTSEAVPDAPDLPGVELPSAGEQAAHERLEAFAGKDLSGYDEGRNNPGADSSSHLSAYLKYGCIHPRTVLAALGEDAGSVAYRNEICWRDFYADVLFHKPSAARENVHPEFDAMAWDEDESRFQAWARGETGFPVVDAGMRQLLREGWIHNRARMIVGSFLVKDLHIDWRRGARHFMEHLVDGDTASNQLGWQWVAGTGTDAAPFFRVFNPLLQGRKFDPDGSYVRRYVPELADVAGGAVHEPWTLPGGAPWGYPRPIVDHAAERAEALSRYEAVKSAR